MNFALTEDQEDLRVGVVGALEELCPATALRQAWESGNDVPGLWQGLAELGLLGLFGREIGQI